MLLEILVPFHKLTNQRKSKIRSRSLKWYAHKLWDCIRDYMMMLSKTFSEMRLFVRQPEGGNHRPTRCWTTTKESVNVYLDCNSAATMLIDTILRGWSINGKQNAVFCGVWFINDNVIRLKWTLPIYTFKNYATSSII